jgi:hypothetical protein
MLSVTNRHLMKCRYAEFYYAECHGVADRVCLYRERTKNVERREKRFKKERDEKERKKRERENKKIENLQGNIERYRLERERDRKK